ncbi:hypothetical protein ES288_D06G162600v1 [Gossypium darwinii]|uniref:Uncharacterized protein n=1 Tax=Gossypium darwinii TaxID=34276 RepID=A0A5D2C6C3_GOSDA|nr:hypothetical protein ES288_D06G162600v1 [Gossypium darwinii]
MEGPTANHSWFFRWPRHHQERRLGHRGRYCVQRLRMWHVRRRRCAYEARASGATCEGTSAAALVGADARASHPIVIGSGLG